LGIICAIGTINVFYNILQLINNGIDKSFITMIHSEVTRYGVESYGHLVRLTGMFTDSNNNGAFLVLTIIFILYKLQIDVSISNGYRLFLKAVLLSAGILLIMTFSRTVWLGAIIFLIAHYFHFGLITQLKIFIAFIITSFVLLYYYNTNPDFSVVIQERFKTATFSTYRNDSHFSVMIQAISICSSSIITLLFGTGVNCLSVYYQNEFNRIGYKAHNYYMQNLAEFGIIGGVIVFIFLFHLLRLSKINCDNNKSFFSNILLISIMCMNFTYDSMVQPFFYIIIITIVICADENHENEVSHTIEEVKD